MHVISLLGQNTLSLLGRNTLGVKYRRKPRITSAIKLAFGRERLF